MNEPKYLPGSPEQGRPAIVRFNGQDCVVSISHDPNIGIELRPIGSLIDTSGNQQQPQYIILPDSPPQSPTSPQNVSNGQSDGDRLRDGLQGILSNPVACVLMGISIMILAFGFTSLIIGGNKPYTEKTKTCQPASWFLFFPVGESCQTTERQYQ